MAQFDQEEQKKGESLFAFLSCVLAGKERGKYIIWKKHCGSTQITPTHIHLQSFNSLPSLYYLVCPSSLHFLPVSPPSLLATVSPSSAFRYYPLYLPIILHSCMLNNNPPPTFPIRSIISSCPLHLSPLSLPFPLTLSVVNRSLSPCRVELGHVG